MVGWHHRLNGHEFEWAPGIGDGQGGLACCSPQDHRVGHNWVTELNWTEKQPKGWVNKPNVVYICTRDHYSALKRKTWEAVEFFGSKAVAQMNTKFTENENWKRFFLNPQCRKDSVRWQLLPSKSEIRSTLPGCFQYAIHLRMPYSTASGHTTHTVFHVKIAPGIRQLGGLETMVIQWWANQTAKS